MARTSEAHSPDTFLAHGTLTNGPTWTTSGKVNGALGFTAASSQYVSLGNNHPLGTGAGTVSAWLRPTSNVSGFDQWIDFGFGGLACDLYGANMQSTGHSHRRQADPVSGGDRRARQGRHRNRYGIPYDHKGGADGSRHRLRRQARG